MKTNTSPSKKAGTPSQQTQTRPSTLNGSQHQQNRQQRSGDATQASEHSLMAKNSTDRSARDRAGTGAHKAA